MALAVVAGPRAARYTIDASTGAVTHAVNLSAYYPPTFGAFSKRAGLLYTLVPYEYTAVGLFSINPQSGAVVQLATLPKGQLDGVAVCEGLLFNGRYLLYVMSAGRSDNLFVYDLNSLKVVNAVSGFYGPLAVDPAAPDTVLAIQNVKPGLRLVRLSPLTNATTELLRLNRTSLGEDLRAQDQASLATDGKSAWFVASYNDPKTGMLYRGMYTVVLSADRASATLVEERPSFGGKLPGVWLGRLDAFPAP